VEISGTLHIADGSIDHITAHGEGYDTAKAALEAALPEGTKLTAIRTDS
jgi:hypothetical protein